MREKGAGRGARVNDLIVNQTKRCGIMLRRPLLFGFCVAPSNWQVFSSSTTCKKLYKHGYFCSPLLKTIPPKKNSLAHVDASLVTSECRTENRIFLSSRNFIYGHLHSSFNWPSSEQTLNPDALVVQCYLC